MTQPAPRPDEPPRRDAVAPRAKRRRRIGQVLLTLGLLVLAATILTFFLAELPGDPEGVMDALDKRASVLSALVGLIGLVFSGAGLWLQTRSAPGDAAPRPESVEPKDGPSHPALPAQMSGLSVSSTPLAGRLPSAPVVVQRELPAAPAGFTGRKIALRQLTQALKPAVPTSAKPSAGGRRVVLVSAVAGMGGVGKTALALVAAHRARDEDWFPGGVFFVDFHGYTPGRTEQIEASAAARQLLRTLGVPGDDLPVAGEEVLALYHEVLARQAEAEQGVLVVADNVADVAQAEPLIPTQACHRLLITSRSTLNLPARQVDLDSLTKKEAVQLLGKALTIRRTTDRRVTNEPQAAAEIVDRCGYLPLAIRIVAAVLATEPDRPLHLTAQELADERRRLDVLQPPDHTISYHPAGIRVSFGLSYRRLLDHPDQARIFRLLSLAPGPDIGSAPAAALDGRPEWQVRLDLRALTAAHLLILGPGERWAMHDLLRLYAFEQATGATSQHEPPDALRRLLNHYLRQAEAANQQLIALDGQPTGEAFTDRASAFEWFDAERVNLVATVRAAPHLGVGELATHLAPILYSYFDLRRHLDDLLTVMSISLACARHLDDRACEGKALDHFGVALQKVGRFEEAIDAHQQAAAIFQELGDRHSEGAAVDHLGHADREARKLEDAIDAHQKAAAIFQELGDRHSEGMAENNLGLALREVGRGIDAVVAHRRAAAIFQELGDRHSEGMALNNLGTALQERYGVQWDEANEEAIDSHRRAATIYVELGDRYREGTALSNLGGALHKAGRRKDAIATYQRALTIYQALGERASEGNALIGLGMALWGEGERRSVEAIDALQQAVTIFQRLGDQHGEGTALANLGNAFQQAGQFEKATAVHQQAAVLFQQMGNIQAAGVVERYLAEDEFRRDTS